MARTKIDAPAKRANGRSWSAGPYVRVAERELWNDLYDQFAEELRQSSNYPRGARLNDEQVDVLAWNLAYHAIWVLRNCEED